jgi:hypothetical protein
MSEESFPNWSYGEVQAKFFLGTTDDEGEPNLLRLSHPGRYLYGKKGLVEEKTPPGTLVLFRYKSKIIASAILSWIERFPDAKENKGAFWFAPESIRIFKPMQAADILWAWPEVSRDEVLSQGPAELIPPANWLRFSSLLRGVAAPVLTYPATVS